MESNEKTSQNQCYIVSLDNGIRNEEPVTIKVFNNFNDGTQLVRLNENVFGVYQSYSLNPDTVYIDDYNIIKADIAELLDIDHEETRRIVTEDRNIGVFTSLNYSQNIETRFSASSIFQQIVEYINEGKITGEEALWVSDVLHTPQAQKGNAIKDKEKIKDIIELGFYDLNKKIIFETVEDLDEKSLDALKKSYIRMILFDMLINRKYRGLDYSLITEIASDNTPLWNTAHFCPISVANNIEKDQLVADNEYCINNYLVDRNVTLSVLFEYYYHEIKKISESLSDASRLYIDAITRIIYNNTELNKASELEKIVVDNLKKISKFQKEKEKLISSENKLNKVEKTMATQSINVRVTAKLDLIQKKYPVNPKEHPELFSKKEHKKEENLKLTVEEEKSTSKGFTNTAIIISAVSLICGIGLGIAYVLITMGS